MMQACPLVAESGSEDIVHEERRALELLASARLGLGLRDRDRFAVRRAHDFGLSRCCKDSQDGTVSKYFVIGNVGLSTISADVVGEPEDPKCEMYLNVS